jgi:hypothetical protein
MNTINLTQLKQYISTKDITFLIDFNRSIYIEKNGKSIYTKMSSLSFDNIDNFILELDFDKVYILNPFISISGKSQDPVVCLSRPFLITNNSNSKIIHEYLLNQSLTFFKQFDANIKSEYFLMFNYKETELKKRA